jgi:hypothetical protein
VKGVAANDGPAAVIAALLVVAGPVVGTIGYLAAADHDAATSQVPYLLSSGSGGAALTATGAVVLAILRRRRLVAVRLDSLEVLVAQAGGSWS